MFVSGKRAARKARRRQKNEEKAANKHSAELLLELEKATQMRLESARDEKRRYRKSKQDWIDDGMKEIQSWHKKKNVTTKEDFAKRMVKLQNNVNAASRDSLRGYSSDESSDDDSLTGYVLAACVGIETMSSSMFFEPNY
jgi:hypothetical protein